MSDSTSANSQDDPIVAAFFRDYEAADRAGDVLHDYCARYPDLAGEFEELAEMRGLLGGSLAERTPNDPLPDRLGDFAIRRRIAHGGMGEIYEAVQEPLGRRVAVKTIRGRDRHLAGVLHSRFLREQKVLAQLHHTHIVPIHAAGRSGELQFFAMPYIDGAALHHVVRTALLHESSTPRTPTPSLAKLAAEAQSRLNHQTDADPGPARESPNPPAANGTPGPPPADSQAMPRSDTTIVAEPPNLSGTKSWPRSASTGNDKLVLSSEYVRSVARVIIDAAEAVQHAHEAGIIHRDLKPSNLMVDRAEHCWVLDFGLAGYLRGAANGAAETNGEDESAGRRGGSMPVPDLGPDPPTVSGVFGTPEYMAPEQFQGRADARTDVWGLGVILYELLTLRRPFVGREPIQEAEPARPRELVRRLPHDLEAICLKAIRKEPARRYQSAKELAEDLRHWLRSEPIDARKSRTMRRCLLWARRNKGWSAAIAVLAAAFVAFGLREIQQSRLLVSSANALAITAEARQHEAEERAAAEHLSAQTQQREALIQRMQRVRLIDHQAGWSSAAWGLAREAATITTDSRIQAEAATLLPGIDAHRVKLITVPGTALAFSPAGKSLIMAGSDLLRRTPERPIQIWNSTNDEAQITEIKGEGVFGFRPDGAPLFLKLPRDRPSTMELCEVSGSKVVGTFSSPLDGKSKIIGSTLTPDGTFVAASARGVDGKSELLDAGAVAVWESATGREVFRAATARVTDVALTPDARLLAAGHEDGHISVWSLPNREPLVTLKADRNTINCLAFSRDPVCSSESQPPGGGWLLAAGDQGGGVVIWDLGMGVPRSICNGPKSSEVFTLAFSPDRMTLASTGRGHVQLWDIASGRSLLSIGAGNYVMALAFSPDGKQLAVGSVAAFGSPDSVEIWELEFGRGIRRLRGVSRSVFRPIFSPDGRLVAGLSDNWHLGIWDRPNHRLLHVLGVTRGYHIDNVGLAFSPDGRLVAFSAGREASLWDVATGKVVRTWSLPAGLVDRIAFADPNRLLLFRVETESGEGGPSSGFDARKYPRVCRVRDLFGPRPIQPLAEIRDCNLHVFHAECSPDGMRYVIEGKGDTSGRVTRVANLYEGLSGKKLGALPTQLPIDVDGAVFRFDTSGMVLAYDTGVGTSFLDSTSRAVLRQFHGGLVECLGPGASRWLVLEGGTVDRPFAFSLFDRDRPEPLFRFMLDPGNGSNGKPQFSADGSHVIWGIPNGVMLVDLVEVSRRMSELGLGW